MLNHCTGFKAPVINIRNTNSNCEQENVKFVHFNSELLKNRLEMNIEFAFLFILFKNRFTLMKFYHQSNDVKNIEIS